MCDRANADHIAEKRAMETPGAASTASTKQQLQKMAADKKADSLKRAREKAAENLKNKKAKQVISLATLAPVKKAAKASVAASTA